MSRQDHVHFIGIGGAGMSAIAKVMVEMGYRVSGSDIVHQESIKQLQTQGVKVYLGHNAEHVQGADLVVYSTGIPRDNVELISAGEQRIPLFHRSQALAQLINQKKGIAVTGTHGKTTTSSMITWMMTQANLDPTFLIGGEVLDFGFNARAGQGEYVVAEADESDASFLKYHPKFVVITNIEEDHLEHYQGDFEKLKDAYAQFISQIQAEGTLIICADDPMIQEILHRASIQQVIALKKIDVITYGVDTEETVIRAEQICLGNRSSHFQVYRQKERIGELSMAIPGKHNVYNALACLSLGLKLHIPLALIRQSLQKFVGAKRRFQVISEANNIMIVDDYAHHPTEIMATIDAAKSTGRKIFAVFQPQRYTRTYYLLEAFSQAFTEADHVIIANIYAPSGEKPIAGVSSQELAEKIRNHGHARVSCLLSLEEIYQFLLKQANPGDLILTMGAGDIWKVAEQLSFHYRNI